MKSESLLKIHPGSYLLPPNNTRPPPPPPPPPQLSMSALHIACTLPTLAVVLGFLIAMGPIHGGWAADNVK